MSPHVTKKTLLSLPRTTRNNQDRKRALCGWIGNQSLPKINLCSSFGNENETFIGRGAPKCNGCHHTLQRRHFYLCQERLAIIGIKRGHFGDGLIIKVCSNYTYVAHLAMKMTHFMAGRRGAPKCNVCHHALQISTGGASQCTATGTQWYCRSLRVLGSSE